MTQNLSRQKTTSDKDDDVELFERQMLVEGAI